MDSIELKPGGSWFDVRAKIFDDYEEGELVSSKKKPVRIWDPIDVTECEDQSSGELEIEFESEETSSELEDMSNDEFEKMLKGFG